MKLCSNLTILLLLSRCFVVSVSGRTEDGVGHRLNGNQSEVGDDQQGEVGPESMQETSSSTAVPDDEAGETPESEDENTKTIDLPIGAEQPHTNSEPFTKAGGSAKQSEDDAALNDETSRTHQSESNHPLEYSEGVESGKEESGVRFPDAEQAEQERLDDTHAPLDSTSPDTLSVDRTEPDDEETDEDIDNIDRERRSTSQPADTETSGDESAVKLSAENAERNAPETQRSDRDSLESIAFDSEKVDPDVVSVRDASGDGAAQQPVEPQTRINASDDAETEADGSREANATGVDEPPSQEVREIANAASILSDAEGDSSPEFVSELPPKYLSEAGLVDQTYSRPVCGVWGKMKDQRRADLNELYLLFENIELGGPRRKEIPNPEDWANQITEDGLKEVRRGRRNSSVASTPSTTHIDHDDRSSTEEKAAKSANSEFVDGLDDIGKFFEDVEPPDELDVGAVGSSIQEVLMGQGTRIILKRLQMGLHFIRTTFSTAKDMFVQRFIDEDGNLTVVDQEKLEAVASWVWKSSKRLYREAHTFLDKLVERGIAGGLSREYEEDEASSSTLPGNNDDVRELLRQYSRVGGGATPKKYA
jgi:hypothetical protein